MSQEQPVAFHDWLPPHEVGPGKLPSSAGFGAFLENIVRYMGYTTADISTLVASANVQKSPTPEVGVVFAESEVITPPADSFWGHYADGHGCSWGQPAQLIRRGKMEPEFTLNGGILCFVAVREVLKREPKKEVNVLEEDLPQFGGALGAALLGKQRLKNLAQEGDRVDRGEENVSIPL